MTPRKYRLCLAAIVTSLTPGLAFAWLNLYVSGYTYNADGSRDLGHLYKQLPTDLFFVAATGVIVFAFGCSLIWIVRRVGPVTAPRMMVAALVAGGLIGLSVAKFVPWLMAISSPVVASILAIEFVIIAAVPWTPRTEESGFHHPQSIFDRVVVAVASGAALAAFIWIGWLFSIAMQHPCNCG